MAERIHVRVSGGLDQVLTRLSEAGLARRVQVRAFDVGASPTVVTLACRRPWWGVRPLVRGRCEVVFRDGVTTTQCTVARGRAVGVWMAALGLVLVISDFLPLPLPLDAFVAVASGLLLTAWWLTARDESRRIFDCVWVALTAQGDLPETEVVTDPGPNLVRVLAPTDAVPAKGARRRRRAPLAGS